MVQHDLGDTLVMSIYELNGLKGFCVHVHILIALQVDQLIYAIWRKAFAIITLVHDFVHNTFGNLSRDPMSLIQVPGKVFKRTAPLSAINTRELSCSLSLTVMFVVAILNKMWFSPPVVCCVQLHHGHWIHRGKLVSITAWYILHSLVVVIILASLSVGALVSSKVLVSIVRASLPFPDNVVLRKVQSTQRWTFIWTMLPIIFHDY